MVAGDSGGDLHRRWSSKPFPSVFQSVSFFADGGFPEDDMEASRLRPIQLLLVMLYDDHHAKKNP